MAAAKGGGMLMLLREAGIEPGEGGDGVHHHDNEDSNTHTRQSPPFSLSLCLSLTLEFFEEERGVEC